MHADGVDEFQYAVRTHEAEEVAVARRNSAEHDGKIRIERSESIRKPP